MLLTSRYIIILFVCCTIGFYSSVVDIRPVAMNNRSVALCVCQSVGFGKF
jgi:hypothetical protein